VAAPSLTKDIQNEKSKEKTKEKDRVGLRLYNTIVVVDVYTIAKSPEAAREALLAAIASGDAKPTEAVAKEVTMANSIRNSWLEEKPFVAADITDEEFETLKGITTGSAFEKFYLKR
jgi:hypothetical protein